MTAYYNEFDPKAAAGLRALITDGLIPPGEVDTRSITDVRPDDLKGFIQCHFFAGIGGWSRALALALWPHDRPVWTGSCPCQPFSSAGKGKGGADHRDLWPVWFRLISECCPAIIFGEQVASAISHGWLDRVYSDMEAEDYACGTAVLPACAVNAPHKRERLWFVAYTELCGRECKPIERPSGLQQKMDGEKKPWRAAGSHCSIALANRDADGRVALPVAGLHDKEYHAESCGIVDHSISNGRRAGRQDDTEYDGIKPYSTDKQLMAHSASGQLSEPQWGSETRNGLRSARQKDPPPQSLADSSSSGPQRGLRGRQDKEREDQHGHAGRSSASGFWDDHEWIVCADGKARRIAAAQSGIRLLAHGISERVGLLRAGGNAIVPQEGAWFITAAREAIGERLKCQEQEI